jgi:hypothetical protein
VPANVVEQKETQKRNLSTNGPNTKQKKKLVGVGDRRGCQSIATAQRFLFLENSFLPPSQSLCNLPPIGHTSIVHPSILRAISRVLEASVHRE